MLLAAVLYNDDGACPRRPSKELRPCRSYCSTSYLRQCHHSGAHLCVDAVLQNALYDPAAVGVGAELLDLAHKGINDELDVAVQVSSLGFGSRAHNLQSQAL